MLFLTGQSLTRKVRSLIRENEEAKLAIAYWGSNALDLLVLNPRQKKVRICCCLTGGKSDPDVISKFGAKARQHDSLHAKVIWTRSGAIVGSANASSNGLPEEESSIGSLIEAGIFVKDESILKQINEWFDATYKTAKRISERDLQLASDARAKRIWSKPDSSKTGSVRTPRRESLLHALDEGPKAFLNRRFYFFLSDGVISKKKDKEAISWIRGSEEEVGKKVGWKIRWSDFEVYEGGLPFPLDAHLIEIRKRGNRVSVQRPGRTLMKRVAWNGFEYLYSGKEVRFPYRIGKLERLAIKAVFPDLKRAITRTKNGFLEIEAAAPLLLRGPKA